MQNLLQTLKDEHKSKIKAKPALERILEENTSCLDISISHACILFWEVYPSRIFDFNLYLELFDNRKK